MARYIPSGVSKVVYAPSVSNLDAPSGAEITAGTILTAPTDDSTVSGLVEMKGWMKTANDIAAPSAANRYDAMIAGRQSASKPSAVFYDDPAGGAVRTALPEGSTGFMIIMKAGQVTGKRAEVWPVRVSTVGDSDVDNKNTASTFEVTFVTTSAPHLAAVIP